VPLTAARRRSLPASAFAYPRLRKYPIHTRKEARAALSRAGQKRTYGSYRHVARAVNRRYPGLATGILKAKGKTRTPRRATRRKR
jgi:hypothetical protein